MTVGYSSYGNSSIAGHPRARIRSVMTAVQPLTSDAAVPQAGQMRRHGRLSQTDRSGQVHDPPVAPGQLVQQRQPSRVAEVRNSATAGPRSARQSGSCAVITIDLIAAWHGPRHPYSPVES